MVTGIATVMFTPRLRVMLTVMAMVPVTVVHVVKVMP